MHVHSRQDRGDTTGNWQLATGNGPNRLVTSVLVGC